MRFESLVGQIGCSDASGSPPLRHFFGAVMPMREATEMGPASRSTLLRNIASIMKI